jgi:hypothetical protein
MSQPKNGQHKNTKNTQITKILCTFSSFQMDKVELRPWYEITSTTDRHHDMLAS